MKSSIHLLCLLVLPVFVGLALTAGCGKPDPFGRQPLKGTVTLEGSPVQYGVITLEPAEGQPAGSTGSIRDGRFDIPKTMGPCPGQYNVWVQVLDRSGEVPAGTPPGQEGPPPKNILPEKYRTGPVAKIVVEKNPSTPPTEHAVDIR